MIKVLSLLWIARRRGAILVWTGHDLEPHSGHDPRLYRIFSACFLRMVDALISLGDAATEALIDRYPRLVNVPVFILPHGHYRDVYPSVADRAAARAELGLPETATVFLMVGQLRRYKNAVPLLTAFEHAAEPHEHLIIAGEIREVGLEAELAEAMVGAKQVQLISHSIPTESLPIYHGAADVVLLPYSQRSALHSGAALMALSFDRPVVVNDTPTMRELRERVGPGWVHLSDSSIEGAIDCARAASRSPRDARAPLDSLDWEPQGRELLRELRRLVNARRGA